MQLFSTDPDQPGIFAVGQIAYGIFALGQMATGVIAIGQIARGFIAIGQGAVGFIAIGQGAIGVFYAVGMGAVGARGRGGVLQLLPKIFFDRHERPKLPPLTALAEFSALNRGWLLARVEQGQLLLEDEPVPVVLSPEAQGSLDEAEGTENNFACLTIEVREELVEERGSAYREAAERDRQLVAKRLTTWYEGPPTLRVQGKLTGIGGLFLRACGFVLLIAAWWLLAGSDIVALFL